MHMHSYIRMDKLLKFYRSFSNRLSSTFPTLIILRSTFHTSCLAYLLILSLLYHQVCSYDEWNYKETPIPYSMTEGEQS